MMTRAASGWRTHCSRAHDEVDRYIYYLISDQVKASTFERRKTLGDNPDPWVPPSSPGRWMRRLK